MYINRERLQKRSINDNLRQLVLIRQDRVLVNNLQAHDLKVLASLQVILDFFFFFTFPKKWVGRAVGNKALNWDGLTESVGGLRNEQL